MHSEGDEDRDDLGLNPPTQNFVVSRALCLGALVMRGEFEATIDELSDEQEAKAEREKMDKLTSWLVNTGLFYNLSRVERASFMKISGSWDQQEIIDAVWRGESLGVILWALSQIDSLPPYDTMFEESAIGQQLGLLEPETQLEKKAKLRPIEEITKARDVAALWHWRAETTRAQQSGRAPGGDATFRKIIKAAAEAAHQDGEIPEPIDGDFPAFGKAYSALSEDEYSTVSSIALERHFALNWLCGYSADWDTTPTES